MTNAMLERPAIRHKFTPKQVRFINAYVKSGNLTQAGIDTLDCSTPQSAASSASRMLKNVEVCSKIEQICARRGISEDWASKIIKRNGTLKKPVEVAGQVRMVPDGVVQMDAAKTVLKLHGHLKTGIDINTDNRQVNIAIQQPADIERLSMIANTLSKLAPIYRVGSIEQQSGEIVDVDKYRAD